MQVAESLQQLSDIVATFESSMEAADGDTSDLDPVLAAVIDPLLEVVQRSSEVLSTKAPNRYFPGPSTKSFSLSAVCDLGHCVVEVCIVAWIRGEIMSENGVFWEHGL